MATWSGLRVNLLVQGSVRQSERCKAEVLVSNLLGLQSSIYNVFPVLGYYSARRITMQRKRKSMLLTLLFAAALSIATAAPAIGQVKQAGAGSPSMPKVGEMAPDFTLNYFDGNDLKPVSLSQYRAKKNVVVAFFIFAFTGG
jgi:AhpC/TSA family